MQRNVIRYTLNLKKKFELIDENLDKVNFKKIKKKYDILFIYAITNAAESFKIRDKLIKITMDVQRIVSFCKQKYKTIFPSSISVYGKFNIVTLQII